MHQRIFSLLLLLTSGCVAVGAGHIETASPSARNGGAVERSEADCPKGTNTSKRRCAPNNVSQAFSTDDLSGGASLGVKGGYISGALNGQQVAGVLRDYYLDAIVRWGGWGLGAEVGYEGHATPAFGSETTFGGFYYGVKILRSYNGITLYGGLAELDTTVPFEVSAVRVQAGAMMRKGLTDFVVVVPRAELQVFRPLRGAEYAASALLFSLAFVF